MKKVNGNTSGIKTVLLEEIQSIYDMKMSRAEFISYELLFALAEYTAKINREISVYISRGGEIYDVSIGSNTEVSLPYLRLRRGVMGLSGVRCIHTHPGGTPHPSSVDIGTLLSSRLDAMAAIGVTKQGRVTGLGVAFVGDKLDDYKMAGPFKVKEIPIYGLMKEIENATQRVRKAVSVLDTKDIEESAILVGVNTTDNSMHELARLAVTAGASVKSTFVKNRPSIDGKYYVGKGNAGELNLLISAMDADMVIFNDELSPLQQSCLEELLCVKVIDRTTLILDIFAKHANTKEGIKQVELAQMKYSLSRLSGQGINLSRLGGGIGTRGPGETKLETDRRVINRRIYELTEDIKKLKEQRKVRRKNREKNGISIVALAGYTNAGKSTLLNRLSGSDVLAEDKLFATLSPVTRKVVMPSGKTVLFSDTVGFIDKLPHDLVAAFEATLEETAQADLVLNVIDASDDDFYKQKDVVKDVLNSLGVYDDDIVEVYNKSDLIDFDGTVKSDRIYISALSDDGIHELLEIVEQRLKPKLTDASFDIAYCRGDIIAYIQSICDNPKMEYLENYIHVDVKIKDIYKSKIESMLKMN